MAMTPAKVQAMIAKSGLPALWRTVRPGIRIESGRAITQETVDYPCHAVVLPTGRVGEETIVNDETEQRKSTSLAYVSAPEGLPQLPSGKDLLIIGSRQYRLAALDLLAPDGTLLLITATVQ
jgi:hypothetical protein